MTKQPKPLVFRLVKTRHDRASAEIDADGLWGGGGQKGALMRVRAIKGADGALTSHVTYVARGANTNDVRQHYYEVLDRDDAFAVDQYTTAVMVDLDALGLSNVDRAVASDLLYDTILEVRAKLLATIPPEPVEAPKPRYLAPRRKVPDDGLPF